MALTRIRGHISLLGRSPLASVRDAATVVGYKSAIMLRAAASLNNRFARPLHFHYRHPVRAVRVVGYPHQLYLRFGSSDARVLDQVFIQQEYAAFDFASEPKVMIDCGANIGCSSVYFLNRYRGLMVLVVEPDLANLELCRRNLEAYADRVEFIHAAVWPRPAGLLLSGQGWATKVREAQPGEQPVVYGIDVPALLARTPNGRVDLLKIDIEWSELEVFREGSAAWLSRVGNIAIELHDAECQRVFFKALAGGRYDCSVDGELTFCRNIEGFDPVPGRASTTSPSDVET